MTDNPLGPAIAARHFVREWVTYTLTCSDRELRIRSHHVTYSDDETARFGQELRAIADELTAEINLLEEQARPRTYTLTLTSHLEDGATAQRGRGLVAVATCLLEGDDPDYLGYRGVAHGSNAGNLEQIKDLVVEAEGSAIRCAVDHLPHGVAATVRARSFDFACLKIRVDSDNPMSGHQVTLVDATHARP